jgi:hypothetical protein
MNTSQIKLLIWTAAGVFGAGLAANVAWIVTRLPEVRVSVPETRLRAVLEDVGEVVQKSDVVLPYQDVEASIINLNWTGKPAPKVVVTETVPTQVDVPKDDVRQLVTVMMISFDAEAPDESRCVLKYTPKARVTSTPPRGANGNVQGWVKGVGDRLEAPIEHIRIEAMQPDGVVFAFDDEERPHELVGPREIELKGLSRLSDESELVLLRSDISIQRRGFDGPAPVRTELVGEGIYRIGFEDAREFEANYADILAREVAWQPHRDARGRPDGIQITQVQSDSMAYQHGVATGDVIKSINGHPVTSPQEAIAFVKNNQANTKKWEVEVESKGRLKTLVYYSPDE